MHIKPRTLSVSFILAVCAVLSSSQEAVAAQPNIVFIISDDHDNEHLGFMGNKSVHTPNLDRLANSGTVFSVATFQCPAVIRPLRAFSVGAGRTNQEFTTTTGRRSSAPVIRFPAS